MAIFLKMSRTVPSSLGVEAQAMSVALGFVEWATLFLLELIHISFDLRGALAVMQERPPVWVTDCKILYDHLLAIGSPTRGPNTVQVTNMDQFHNFVF